MLNQFMEEVIANGPEAVLPHQLAEQWLDMIYTASRRFVRATALAAEGERKTYDFSDLYSNLMLASVLEIIHYHQGRLIEKDQLNIPEDELYESILCYAMSVIYESIRREAGIGMPPPTVDTILDRDRLFEIEQSSPELTGLLQQVILENDAD